ncbi:unnamed protein product [Schistosoma turkestanicum]|nr:unnamed protein product [Schistosoma turkestanicum]
MYMFSWQILLCLLIDASAILSDSFPAKVESSHQIGSNDSKATRRVHGRYQLIQDAGNDSFSVYTYDYHDEINNIFVVISIPKKNLQLVDNYQVKPVTCLVNYSSQVPLVLSYDLDSTLSVELVNKSLYRLPPSTETSTEVTLYILPKLLGSEYLLFSIDIDKQFNDNLSIHHQSDASSFNTQDVNGDLNEHDLPGFPVTVLLNRGIGYRIYRIFVVILVTSVTFTMGCDLEVALLWHHLKTPISISIGFFCQFFFMPLTAICLSKLIPMKPEFGFGLLTIACSPGGGASNGWSFLLGGDINLSMVMTFISNLSALFMVPFLLFIYSPFFIDNTKVEIPYGQIVLQLLQLVIPALLGLALRTLKPKWAMKFSKLVGPIFKFYVIFFLTIGVYINWPLFRLLGVYPLLILACALLPWIGFCVAALFAFILRQSFQLIITVALETGIQNIAVGVLILLYTMHKPDGELGSLMPLTVAKLTPIPLYFIYLGLLIKRKCCNHQNKSSDTEGSVATTDNEIMNPVADNNVSPTKVPEKLVATTVTDNAAHKTI